MTVPPGVDPSALRPFAEIARGPLAVVSKAFDPASGAVVLLKTLRPEAAADPARQARFAAEARLAATVSHPNVVRVLGADERALVAEWVEGRDAGAVVAEVGPVPAALVAFVGREAARGLAAVHAAGIVHRDLSPGNVLLGDDGAVRLTDFGLASLAADAFDGAPGEVRGTLRTLAPETVRGAAPAPAADLFALGAVLAELATGRAPFARPDAAATLDAVLHADPALDADPRVPPVLAVALTGLLDKDPAGRPASAGEAADRLAAVCEALGAPSADDLAAFLVDPTAYVPPQVVGPASVTPARLSADDRASQTRPWRRAWAAGAAAVAVAVGAAVLWPRPEPPAGRRPVPSEPVRSQTIVPRRPDTLVAADATVERPPEPADAAPEPVARPAAVPAERETPIPGRPPTGSPAGPPAALATPPEVPPPDLPAAPVEPGTLRLVVDPWARVSVDGRAVGTSPLGALRLPPGEHRVTLENPDFPAHTALVRVEPGREARLAVSLWETVARVTLDVRPWAVVSVDGERWDTVPPQGRPLVLAPGRHVLRFEHPTLAPQDVPVVVAAGERPTVRVRLAPR